MRPMTSLLIIFLILVFIVSVYLSFLYVKNKRAWLIACFVVYPLSLAMVYILFIFGTLKYANVWVFVMIAPICFSVFLQYLYKKNQQVWLIVCFVIYPLGLAIGDAFSVLYNRHDHVQPAFIFFMVCALIFEGIAIFSGIVGIAIKLLVEGIKKNK
jgi:hypothetical protein